MFMGINNCSYYNYDYKYLSKLRFEDAKKYVDSMPLPYLLPCNEYVFLEPPSSISKEVFFF